MDPTAQALFDYLGSVIYDPTHAKLNIDQLPKDFQEFGKGLVFFAESYLEVCNFTKALARGDLTVKPPPSSNELAAAAKSLHASLKHLTWQTQQAANGHYEQRVNFMGDFSTAFNDMVVQLERRQAEWMKEMENKRQEALILEDAANRDALTKVFSRRYGLKVLTDWMAEKRNFILCFADIDNLKYVNDKYLHPEGDRYIIAVSDTLRKFSADVILCRMGGDEFMLLQSGWSEEQTAERMNALIIDLAKTADDRYYRSVSFGVVAMDKEKDISVSDLLASADEKMYAYKRAHRRQTRSSQNTGSDNYENTTNP